jgi:hypothetical protein
MPTAGAVATAGVPGSSAPDSGNPAPSSARPSPDEPHRLVARHRPVRSPDRRRVRARRDQHPAPDLAPELRAREEALHPNTPSAHRAKHLATARVCTAPANPDRAPAHRTLELAAHATAHTTILDTPLKDLRHLDNTSSRALITQHLTTALTHMHQGTPTPDEALTIDALEPTFPGTAAELITTAHALAT